MSILVVVPGILQTFAFIEPVHQRQAPAKVQQQAICNKGQLIMDN